MSRLTLEQRDKLETAERELWRVLAHRRMGQRHLMQPSLNRATRFLRYAGFGGLAFQFEVAFVADERAEARKQSEYA
ncbi:hypothetical protein [Roseomonas elaeocarpi]|uniref:DUF559 domain-containing protein n=1 Tax=Roseomonas elaeocarpi TaxID=907779 RepID=A0ABV6JQC8_9PROT